MTKKIRLLGCLLGIAAVLAVASAPRAQTLAKFDLPSQPLAASLRAVGSQTSTNILFDPPLVEGREAPALKASLTLDEVFTRLLIGTGLKHRFLDDKTVMVISATDPRASEPPQTSQVQPDGAHDQEGVDFANRIRMARVGDVSGKTSGAQEAAAEKGAESAETKLDEVIVTARKRSENLQNVPISIAVLTADDINRRGLVHAEDYLRGIPGANQTDAYGGQAIVIRGVETNVYAQGFFAGTTTGTFFGETPTTGSGGMHGGSNTDIKLVDIERVEVLRGPQGTAFGSSSMGGAVRTIPVAPKLDRFEGKFGAGYSATSGTGGENYQFQAVGNVPLIANKLALRAVAYAFSDSGYYRNRAGSDPAFQSAVVVPLGVQAFATDEEEVGAAYSSGARASLLFQATDSLRFTLNYLSQKNETDGWPLQTIGNYQQAILRVAPELVFRGQTAGVYDHKIDIANLVTEYDMGWADLLATYSYVRGESTLAIPYTIFGPPLWSLSAGGTTPHRKHTGEIRLATKLGGAWDFLAGLYGEKIDDRYYFSSYWDGNPATSIVPGVRDLGGNLQVNDIRQRAAFGEVSWKFLPGFTLSGGVRAYSYDRTFRQKDTRGAFGGAPRRDEGDASGTTFRANLSYQPADNALLYAGWAQGFRMGKPQARAIAAQCDLDGDGLIDGTNTTLESTGSVGPDSVDSYELGGKFSALGRRLTVDAAVFRVDWTGIPVTERPPCFAIYLVNAGEARSEGAEVQVNYRLTNALRFDIGGSWINARLTSDVPAQGFVAGDRLPGTPKINGNLGLEYGFNVAGHPVSVRADAIYVGDFSIALPAVPNTNTDSYVKLDASARLSLDKVDIDLYVRNVTNEDAFTSRGNFRPSEFIGYRLRPRTIGLQLGYSF